MKARRDRVPYRESLAQSRDRGSKEYLMALLEAVGGNVAQVRAEDYRPK